MIFLNHYGNLAPKGPYYTSWYK